MDNVMNSHPTRLLPRSTSSNTGELWPELARCTLLLLAVSLAVTTGRAVGAFTTTTRTDSSGARGASCLFVCGRDNFSGEMEPAKVSSLESENQ